MEYMLKLNHHDILTPNPIWSLKTQSQNQFRGRRNKSLFPALISGGIKNNRNFLICMEKKSGDADGKNANVDLLLRRCSVR